jgi:glutamyl-tRNA synthetase
LRARFEEVAVWEHEPLEASLRTEAEALGVGAGKLIHPLRVALTGATAGPGIFDVVVLLGRDETVRRLDRALEWLAA